MRQVVDNPGTQGLAPSQDDSGWGSDRSIFDTPLTF